MAWTVASRRVRGKPDVRGCVAGLPAASPAKCAGVSTSITSAGAPTPSWSRFREARDPHSRDHGSPCPRRVDRVGVVPSPLPFADLRTTSLYASCVLQGVEKSATRLPKSDHERCCRRHQGSTRHVAAEETEDAHPLRRVLESRGSAVPWRPVSAPPSTLCGRAPVSPSVSLHQHRMA